MGFTQKNPPMKIGMMLHFATIAEAYHNRFCKAYVTFVKQLLVQGMIERTTAAERENFPGWSYRATEKGRMYVSALTTVQYPVQQVNWVMPDAEHQR